ncbi:MAG: phosphopantothenoylcysteine decarboxylase [Phycisphaerales bacterium]|nr:phosphopantothenoylcysteine decarboxylase [Phycisphaerales bacterium]
MPDPAFQDKTILVGLTGGISCYKTASIVSRLVQGGASVSVCMTEAATRFVAPLTFQALSGRPVYTSAWMHIESHDPQHVSSARQADLMLIAPCTMDMLAKLAIGRADDIVSLIAAAVDRNQQPVLLAPAMNEAMWNQPATQRNCEQLREDGYEFIGPETGWQACRTSGAGRMSEPEQIIERIEAILSSR